MAFQRVRATEIVGVLFTCLLASISLRSHSFVYVVTGILSAVMVLSLVLPGNSSAFLSLKDLLKRYLSHPLRWPLLLLSASALLSIPTSWDPVYSARVFVKEFVLRPLFYITVSLWVTYRGALSWHRHFQWANIAFLILYFALLLQWILFRQHPLLLHDHIDLDLTRLSLHQVVFLYGQNNKLFDGINDISAHVLIFIASSFVFWRSGLHARLNMVLFVLNIVLLITTTKRAPVIVVAVALLLTGLLTSKARRYVAAGTFIVVVMVTALFATDLRTYFIRQDKTVVESLLRKDLEFLSEPPQSSVAVRIHAYRAFGRELLESPFTGCGIGRRNIREAMPKAVAVSTAAHGHNVFLDFALQMGVQGALALAVVVFAQGLLLHRAWKSSGDHRIEPYMLLGLIFLVMFWGANLFEDTFRNQRSILYWLVTGLCTGLAMKPLEVEEPAA